MHSYIANEAIQTQIQSALFTTLLLLFSINSQNVGKQFSIESPNHLFYTTLNIRSFVRSLIAAELCAIFARIDGFECVYLLACISLCGILEVEQSVDGIFGWVSVFVRLFNRKRNDDRARARKIRSTVWNAQLHWPCSMWLYKRHKYDCQRFYGNSMKMCVLFVVWICISWLELWRDYRMGIMSTNGTMVWYVRKVNSKPIHN